MWKGNIVGQMGQKSRSLQSQYSLDKRAEERGSSNRREKSACRALFYTSTMAKSLPYRRFSDYYAPPLR